MGERTNYYDQLTEALENAGWYLSERLGPYQERWIHNDTGKGITINPRVKSRKTVERTCDELGIVI